MPYGTTSCSELHTRRPPDTLARSNTVKNEILDLANGVAALAFILGPVQWSAVARSPSAFSPAAGPGLSACKASPAGPLRVAIALAGVPLAVHLGLEAYR